MKRMKCGKYGEEGGSRRCDSSPLDTRAVWLIGTSSRRGQEVESGGRCAADGHR